MHRLLTFLTLLFRFIQPSSAQSQLNTRLDSFFHTLPSNQPGIALSIQKHGVIIYQNTAGLAGQNSATPLDSTSNFRMASVTKQFTAMAILLLERDHRLTLDDPIGRWLPELPATVGHHVLIRHLLTHSSGIEDYESLLPDTRTTQVLDADVLQLLSRHDTTYFPPGTRFRYSNSGFCLLALIIERASHETYAAFIKAHIFLPLHMDHSTVYEKDRPIFHRAMGFARDNTGAIIPRDQSITSATKGDGGVYTSLVDYRKWIRALQQNRLLDLSATLKRLRFPIQASPDNPNPGNYYAAGWFITPGPSPVLYHSGSTCGFENQTIWIPRDGWSITYFSNLADNSAPFATILKILDDVRMLKLAQVLSLENQTR
ncbi:MAG TPA: serine hydrolase domain-containing protein [Puia sp.]|jgi:CubicO group peptidase (beta-lactamase class C family)|nr:serine hydrolase domain-containing protein [Puia sp.]